MHDFVDKVNSIDGLTLGVLAALAIGMIAVAIALLKSKKPAVADLPIRVASPPPRAEEPPPVGAVSAMTKVTVTKPEADPPSPRPERRPPSGEAHVEHRRAQTGEQPRAGGGYMPKPGAGVPPGPAGGSGPHERSARMDMRFGSPGGEEDFERWKDKKDKSLVTELEQQNTALTNILSMLPGFTRRMSETTKKRELAPLLADMVMRLSIPPPEKVMVFFVSKSKNELVLAARVGYDEAGSGDKTLSAVKIPKTWGRLGYVLKNQLTMDTKDFERDQIIDEPPPGQTWKTEVAAPLVANKEVLGVVSAEGFPVYSKNAKRLIGVTADLGALAISLAEKTALIQHQANSDALTGLFNKRYFFERLEFELERSRDQGKPLSLFMFDIDHFKKFNDRNGHQAGDEALKITGQLLNERKRDSDIAARYGGEEFIVILPNTTKDGAFAFGEAFRKAVEQYPYPHGEGQPLGKVSISGGVSTYGEDGNGPSALIEAADACLYKSKEAGRNAVHRMTKSDVLA